MNHVPGYIKSLPQLREKGVDIVAVVAFNDPFVMSAWGKVNQVRGDDIVSRTTDPQHCFSELMEYAAFLNRPRCQVFQEYWMGR